MTDPLPAPYSFRGGLLWSFRELGKFSMPIRPTKPTPNNPPEATSPKTSTGVQRLYTRLAQIIQELHHSQQRQSLNR